MNASIVHDARALRCQQLDRQLELGWGPDSSAVLRWPGPLPAAWLVSALDQMFVVEPSLSAVVLPYKQWREEPQAVRLFERLHSDHVHRSEFWQLPLWLQGSRPARSQPSDECVYDSERELYFPRRAAQPEGEVYRRYDPRVRRVLSFRVTDPVQDVERFTRWMNDPRVAYYWEQTGTEDVQRAYLERQQPDPHLYSLIGSFDDQPFGYFEVYWAAEDRIGRYYTWQPFDRGIHLLVGEQNFRGRYFINSWLRGLSHYLWLDDSRTQRFVMEPRSDNSRMLQHLPLVGFHGVREFDFPHKRAWLMLAQRQTFFTEVGL